MIDKELENIVSKELASKEDLMGYEAEKANGPLFKTQVF
jgi:hypothetical protein